LQNYARAEDVRLKSMLKGEFCETQRAVAVEIVASAKPSGIETSELVKLFNGEWFDWCVHQVVSRHNLWRKMIMWMLTCVAAFSAGYAASVYSWPTIKIWINGVAAEAGRFRARAADLEAKLRDH
jgi:hypothetical protein